MKKHHLMIALGLAFSLAACGGEEKPAANTEAPKQAAAEKPAAPAAPAAPTVAANPLTDAAMLQKAQESLQAMPQFAGKELHVFQDVIFYSLGIKIDVQDPNKPENIDHYEFKFKDGKWSEPSPVQISGGGDMKANLTPMKNIRFADVAEKFIPLYKQTAQKENLAVKLPEPDNVVFKLWVPSQERYWQAPMDTDRAQMFLRMNPDGSLKELMKP